MFIVYKTSMSRNIRNFPFGDLIIIINDNDFSRPWFLSTQAALMLDYNEPRKAIYNNIDNYPELGIIRKINIPRNELLNLENVPEVFDYIGSRGVVSLISTGGLFALVMKSRSRKALPFQLWVTEEVLPALLIDGQEYRDDGRGRAYLNQAFAINGTCVYVDPRTGYQQQYYDVDPYTQHQMDKYYIAPPVFASVFNYNPITFMVNMNKLLYKDLGGVSIKNFDMRRASQDDMEINNMAMNMSHGGIGIRDRLSDAALYEVEMREQQLKNGQDISNRSIFGAMDTTANRSVTPNGNPIKYVVVADPLSFDRNNDPNKMHQRMNDLRKIAEEAERLRMLDAQLGYGDYNTNDYEGVNTHYDDELDNI